MQNRALNLSHISNVLRHNLLDEKVDLRWHSMHDHREQEIANLLSALHDLKDFIDAEVPNELQKKISDMDKLLISILERVQDSYKNNTSLKMEGLHTENINDRVKVLIDWLNLYRSKNWLTFKEITSPYDPDLKVFYNTIFSRAFPIKEERESLRSIMRYIGQEKLISRMIRDKIKSNTIDESLRKKGG
ncbi:MAG: hypothetical protein QXK37_03240 [Candidatus Woesearchaeota archaeon]